MTTVGHVYLCVYSTHVTGDRSGYHIYYDSIYVSDIYRILHTYMTVSIQYMTMSHIYAYTY